MRRVPLLLLLLAVVGAGSLVAPAVASAAPAPSYDALIVRASTFDGSGAQPPRVFEPSDVTVTQAQGDQFASAGGTGSATASVSFTAPRGETFASRKTFNLEAAPTTQYGSAVVTHDGLSCAAQSYGYFSADEAVVDGAGNLTALSVRFEVRCDGAYLSGFLRFHSTRGWSAVRAATDLTQLGDVVLGNAVTRTTPLRVVGQGSAPLARPTTLYGTPEDGTSIVGTTCAATVDVGDTCTITLRFAPRTAGGHTPSLSFVSDPFGESARVVFSGTGLETDLGTFHPTGPARVLDTRGDVGGHRGALGPGDSVVVRPDTGSDPASAYVLNLTAVSPTTSGYLTAYPTGKAVPGTASVNLASGRTVAHLVTVPAGTDGSVTIRNAAGSTHVVADLVGWYSADDDPLAAGATRGGGYHRGGVQRLLDTRSGRAVKARQYVTVSARYPGRHVAALAVNVTVTAPLASGYVTAWNAASDTPPLASTLNFNRGETVSNAAIVPASACTTAAGCNDSATIAIANGSGGGVHVIVDVTGYFDDGSVTADVRFHPLTTPTRIVDTRTSLGTTPFLAGETHAFDPSVVGPDTVALDGDVTAVRPTRSTYLTVWPDTIGYQRPRASTVNAAPGQVVGNHVLAAVGGDRGSLAVFNYTGNVDVVADVDGTFDAFPPSPPDGIQRLRDAFLPTSDSPVRPVYRLVR